MDEFLPSIGIQKGFNYTNNFHNHQRYSSVSFGRKTNYQNYNHPKYNNNYRSKQEFHNKNNYANNFLKIANTNRDEVNSIKNNTAITYYNKSYINRKSTNNNNKDNIFPETYYNYYQKFTAKKPLNKITSNNYNNIKIIQGNTKNLNLLLPDFQKEINNNKSKKQRAGYAHSYSVSNKENKNNTINKINNNNNTINNNTNNINTNNAVYNLKNNSSNFLNFTKLDTKKIIPKINDNLTTIGFLPNRSNLNFFQSKTTYTKNRNRGLSTDDKYMKPYKTNTLFNKNPSNAKVCPICHKEIENYRYRFHLNLHPSKIFNWLYLGSYRNACDKQEIRDIGINYVLNCAIECMESFPVGVKYCHLKLNDMPSFRIIPYLEKATSFINQAHINKGIILVHCQLGISRSTSCVIAYLIKYMGYTTMNALDFIKKKRSQVMPNFGFLQQLMIYEKNNIGVGKKESEDNIENKT